MRKILLILIVIIASLNLNAQQVTVDLVNSANACGLQTNCFAGLVCYDIVMAVDANKNLDSYNIWVTYDNNVLSRVNGGDDKTCVIADGGDTDLENAVSAYRVGGIPSAPFPMTANTPITAHTICFQLLDLNAFNGTTITVGGDKFNGALKTTVTFDDATFDDVVPESPLVVNPSNSPCLVSPPIISEDPQVTDEDVPVTFCPTISDPNLGDTLTVTTCSAPFNGIAVPDTSNCITYTPNANFNGLDSVCVVVCDQTGLCDSTIVPITVNPLNDAPIAVDDTTSTDEDMQVLITVIGNDTDVDGNIDPTSVGEVSAPVNGSIIINPITGEIAYTPNLNFNGVDSFEYLVCDDGAPLPALCDTALVTITITATNDAPIAVDDSETTNEDTPVMITVIGNDTDVDGNIDSTSVEEITAPVNGSISVNSLTGEVTYTPNLNFNGVDSFEYVVCDDGTPLPALCDTALVTITITATNDAPIAVDDTTSTDEDLPVLITVIGNDTDSDGNIDPTSVGEVTSPSNGSILINPLTGEVTYTPNLNFNGVDSFEYVVCDDGTPLPALCDTAEVTITISAINDAIVAVDDIDTTNENTSIIVDVLINDTDVDGNIDSSSVAEITAPTNGSISINATTGEITYTPNTNFNGIDIFEYVVCDDGTPLPALCDTAQVTITVLPVNNPPVALNDNAFTIEDVPVDIPVYTNDTDPLDPSGNIDPTTVTEVNPPNNGSTSVNPLTGVVTYTPSLHYYGNDTFSYSICDDGTPLPIQCDTAQVFIIIFPQNDAPLAVDDTISTPEDTDVIIDVVANDNDDNDPLADIDPTSVNVIDSTANGTLIVNALTGEVTYSPNPEFNGLDTFTYVVCDDGNPLPVLCDTADVFITVTPVNDVPEIMQPPVIVPEDDTVVFCPMFSDPDNSDILTLGFCSAPVNGSAILLPGDTCIQYIPNPNFNGMDSLCLVVCDNGTPILCDSIIVPITVTPLNDAPIALNDIDTTDEDVSVIINVLNNDNDNLDPLGNIDPTSVIEVNAPSNGSISINPATGEIIYTPILDYNGMDTFTYAVCDDGNPLPALCDTAEVFILINPIQDCDSLVLNVFLEGSFDGTGMNTLLNEYHLLPGQNPALSTNGGAQFLGVAAPVGQPYNVAPFNYMGTEGDFYGDTAVGATSYDPSVVDWVLVSIRENNTNASSKIWECAALLNNDGTIEIPETCPCLVLSDSTDYHIVIEHRNHLAIMSTVVQKTDGNLTFDFTTNQSWKLDIGSPNEAAQKQIGNNYVMYSGNGNQVSGRTDINSADNAVWITDFGSIFIYKSGDHNLDADVNSVDRSLWLPNNGFFNLIQF